MAKEKDSSLLTYETHIRLTDEMRRLLFQRSRDEGISSNAVIQKAVSLYLTKDTMDESLVIAKMTDVQRQIARLKHEIDVKQKLDLEWYQYFFLFAPPIPQEEVGLRMQKANKDVYRPDQCAAQGTDGDTQVMDVEQNGEADAADEAPYTLCHKAVVHHAQIDRNAPQSGGDAPGSAGAQGKGGSHQKHLNDPVHTGVGIAVDDIPHGVGEQQAGHQQHQSADGNGVGIRGNACGSEGIGQHGHQEGRGNGPEELVGFQTVQIFIHNTHQQTAKTSADAVHQGTAHKEAESAGTQQMGNILGGYGIAAAGFTGLGQHFVGNFQRRLFGDEAAAQGIEPLHSVHVVAGVADAAHPGDGSAILSADGDHDVIGNGKDVTVFVVGGQHSGDTFLHTESLGTAHGKFIAQVDGQVQKKVIVHGKTLL